jgi:putative transcriptional regulator
MTEKRKYKSDAFEAIHSSAKGLFDAGVINKKTMRDFDEMSLAKPPVFSASDIRRIRLRHKVSQPIFARLLNTSESTIEKWETGAKKPSGMAMKLLSIVEKRGLEALG